MNTRDADNFSDDERPDIAALIDDCIRALVDRIRQVQEEVRENFDDKWARSLGDLIKAAAQLIKEKRNTDEAMRGRARKLTREEQQNVFVEWFRKQPPETQRLLCQQITRIYNEGIRAQVAGG